MSLPPSLIAERQRAEEGPRLLSHLSTGQGAQHTPPYLGPDPGGQSQSLWRRG